MLKRFETQNIVDVLLVVAKLEKLDGFDQIKIDKWAFSWTDHFFVNVSNNIGTYLLTQNQGFPYKPKFEIIRSLDSIDFSNTSGYPFKVKHTARVCATNPFHCSEPFSIGTAKIDFQLIDTICLGDTINLSVLNIILSFSYYLQRSSVKSSAATL